MIKIIYENQTIKGRKASCSTIYLLGIAIMKKIFFHADGEQDEFYLPQ